MLFWPAKCFSSICWPSGITVVTQLLTMVLSVLTRMDSEEGVTNTQ